MHHDESLISTCAGNKLAFFIYGSALGALVTLLLAPQSGRKTREIIVDKAREGKETIDQGIRTGQKRWLQKKESLEAEAERLLHKAQDLTDAEKDTIMAAIEAGKKVFREKQEAMR